MKNDAKHALLMPIYTFLEDQNNYFKKIFLQEQWRCLDQSKSFNYVMETHDLLIHSPKMNPEHAAYVDFDCPVIDPVDSETWCANGPDFYPVPCRLIYHILYIDVR